MTLIAIHLLQNHAPSNLNRDDNGDPKDAIFGGVRRARISSQALKRSIRISEGFQSSFSQPGLFAKRSQLANHISKYLEDTGKKKEVSEEIFRDLLTQASKLGKANSNSDGGGEAERDEAVVSTKAQLLYLTELEVKEVAEKLLELAQTGKFTVKRKKKDVEVKFSELSADELRGFLPDFEPHSVDIAMFGRMITSSNFKNIDAAVQVSHAISTHKIDPEFDYYTAVDDLDPNGAGFIGDVAFNSATYYKYINIHWQGLLANLRGERDVAKQAVGALLRAAMTAIPTGKQNTFAAHNLPDFALVEVIQQNIPVSYANAFLRPVRAGEDESLMDRSIAALTAYAGPLPERFDLDVERAVFPAPADLPKADVCGSVSALAEWVAARLPQDPAL